MCMFVCVDTTHAKSIKDDDNYPYLEYFISNKISIVSIIELYTISILYLFIVWVLHMS